MFTRRAAAPRLLGRTVVAVPVAQPDRAQQIGQGVGAGGERARGDRGPPIPGVAADRSRGSMRPSRSVTATTGSDPHPIAGGVASDDAQRHLHQGPVGGGGDDALLPGGQTESAQRDFGGVFAADHPGQTVEEVRMWASAYISSQVEKVEERDFPF